MEAALINRLDRLISLLEQTLLQQTATPQEQSAEEEPQRVFSMPDAILERHEAAAYLRISVAHLDNKIRQGELAVTRIGRRVLIKREMLDQWLNEQSGCLKAVNA